MSNGDYGYFGKGDTGYAQYMTAFNRNFGGSSGGGGHLPANLQASHDEPSAAGLYPASSALPLCWPPSVF